MHVLSLQRVTRSFALTSDHATLAPMDAPQPVLIYDGRCRFCVREASRLARWVRGGVRLESFRDAGVIERYPGLTAAQCEQALQLIEPDGRIRSGAEAVARTLRLNPRIAPLTWVYYVPLLRSVFDRGYRIVARNRFRLRGEVCTDETCGVHQAREPPPGRTHVRDLFLRLLGLIFLIAFLSLLSQPRVDFQLWFLLLRGRQPRDLYFRNLLARLFQAPDVVASLFSSNPFPDAPPQFIRLGFYRYRFTDWATRRATGAWWQREPSGYSKPFAADSFRK